MTIHPASGLWATLAFSLWLPAAAAQEGFTVRAALLADQKAVFATVESLDVVPARTRIVGTAGRRPGGVLAVVADQ